MKSKKHVCKAVHPGMSHETWKELNKTEGNDPKKTNPIQSDPDDTTGGEKDLEYYKKIREKHQDWWKKQKKKTGFEKPTPSKKTPKPMEFKHGGKTKKSSKGSSGRYSQHN